MAFPRADGQPLQIGARAPEIGDLAGATFVVNGRAFGGTGVGYNSMAVAIRPAAAQRSSTVSTPSGTDAIGAESRSCRTRFTSIRLT